MKVTKKATPNDLQKADARGRFVHMAPPGVRMPDVLRPEYWTAHADVFRRQPRSLIEVISADGNWEAWLRTGDVSDEGSVHLSLLLRWTRIASLKLSELPEGYTVRLSADGWCAKDQRGNVILSGITHEGTARAIALRHGSRHGVPISKTNSESKS